jgi:hypothetical protein
MALLKKSEDDAREQALTLQHNEQMRTQLVEAKHAHDRCSALQHDNDMLRQAATHTIRETSLSGFNINSQDEAQIISNLEADILRRDAQIQALEKSERDLIDSYEHEAKALQELIASKDQDFRYLQY